MHLDISLMQIYIYLYFSLLKNNLVHTGMLSAKFGTKSIRIDEAINFFMQMLGIFPNISIHMYTYIVMVSSYDMIYHFKHLRMLKHIKLYQQDEF
jgi:hypothetical protein